METEASNDLRHRIETKDSDGNDLIIHIRLNDECKNGHQDFAITGDGWEKGQPRIGRYNIYAGCCHEEILKVRPDLKIFVNLHLADYTGCPMYAVANGFYHLRTGFNNTKPDDPGFKDKFCEYYRVSSEQFDSVALSENELRYAIKLETLGVLEQWAAEANTAIKQLEQWTKKKFVVDSVRTQYERPTPEEVASEKKKEAEGYYHPDLIKAREQARIEAEAVKQFDKIRAERDKKIAAAKQEYEVEAAVLKAGLSLDSFIFYNHTRTGSFNWKDYGDRITKEQFEAFVNSEHAKIEGVKWECK